MQKISKFLDSLKIQYQIFTSKNEPYMEKFDLGISYCYPKKITEPLLSVPKKGFVNYHPGPLPRYKGPNEFEDGIKNNEIHWGVTVHFMDEEYDNGPIIKIKNFDLHEGPKSIQELGAISHYFLFQLFKDTVIDIYNEKYKK